MRRPSDRILGSLRFYRKEPYLSRLVTWLLWLSLVIGLLVVLVRYTPLGSLPTVIRLWTEELQPPLHVPVEGIRSSELTDTWGAARSGGRTHEGIDIFAPCGHPVVSSTEGFVTTVGESRLGGQIVWVFGPEGSRHYYAHLGRYGDIRPGNHVQPGDTLGFVGNTGNAQGTPCHLHYGIYLDGGPQNPFPYLMQP